MNSVDEHQTLVVQALTNGATAIANRESRFDSRLAALKDRADQLVIMYQAPQHWCVEQWTSVYRNAKSGEVTFINSPFVATARNGHRFSLRVYPFGYDSGTWVGFAP